MKCDRDLTNYIYTMLKLYNLSLLSYLALNINIKY